MGKIWGTALIGYPIFYGFIEEKEGVRMAENRPPWERGKAVALPLPPSVGDSSQRNLSSAERDIARQVRVVEIIQIEVGRIRRNYPGDGIEQRAFDRIQKLLTILINRYKEE